jgi:DNA-binding transcriptional MerR regulator
MKLKIGKIAKRSGVRPSTIRYYVAEGLLPRPEKTNEKMAYYDEACIDRLRAIQELKEKRFSRFTSLKTSCAAWMKA